MRCTHTCCTNDDCAGYDWAPICRKPYPFGTSLHDTNYDAILYSLGRRFHASGGIWSESVGMSGLCMP